ncbi:MAG TPA: Ig-like domain-containing protein, partial [Candidatus Acidoferrales bacterium]|nr:Ig-like domain-containing protein [Candidatus Acidoferrales bacterium]
MRFTHAKLTPIAHTCPRVTLVLVLLCSAVSAAHAQSLNSTSVSFGNVVQNTTSAPKTVTLTNSQAVPLVISSITVSGDFAETSKCPISPNTLAAGATCQIQVTYTPTVLASESGTLAVNDNATNTPQTAQLSGTGVPPVGVTPASYSFSNQFVGTTSAARVVAVNNYQTTPLTIASIAATGDFTVTTTTCPLAPNTLAAKTTCTVSVAFAPIAAGTRKGTLTVTYNASNSPQSVALSGTGVLPVSVTPGSVTFSGQHPGNTSNPTNITLKNGQSTPLTISAISTSGDFAESSTTCPLSPNTLASAASCTISVTFTPTTLGTRTGSLTITDTASTSPQIVTLSGSGVLTGLNTITVTPSNPSMFVGNQQQFTATANFSNGSTLNITSWVTWFTSDSAQAQVTSGGLVTALAPGKVLIVAKYLQSSGSTTANVSAKNLTSITVTPGSSSLPVGAYQQFSALLTYSDGSTQNTTSDVAWSSSSKAVASINATGMANASSIGSTTIKATLGSVSGSTTFTVFQPSCAAAPAGLVGWWTGDGNTVDLGGQNSGTLQNGASYGAGEVGQAFSFTGNGASVLVNSPLYSPPAGTLSFWFMPTGSGALTGGYAGGQNRAPGLLIDSSNNLNWEYGNLSSQSIGQVNLNQWNHAALTYSTSNSQTSVSVYLNGILVDAAVTDANTAWNPQVAFGAYVGAQQTSFTGSMDEIAVFNQALTPLQIQQIYNAFSAGICKPTLQTIAVNPPSPTLVPGLSLQLDAVGSYSDNSTHDLTTSAIWGSSNSSVATVSPSGLVTANASGGTSVSASLGTTQGSTSLSVSSNLLSLQVNPQSPSTDIGVVTPFTATGTFSGGNQQDLTSSVNWMSSAPAVATVGPSGQVTSLSAGQATITAIAGSVNASSVISVSSVALQSIAVSPANPQIATGTTQPFTAIGTFSDGTQQNLTASVSWSSSTPAATIAANGVSTGVGAGQTTITASMGSVSGTASLTVTTAVLAAIQISPTSPSLAVGGSQQFSATAIYSDGSAANITASATWNSSSTAVVSMSSTSPGLAAGMGSGQTTIAASFGGLTDSTTLSVQDPLVAISIAPSTTSVGAGQTRQFIAIGT